MDENIYAGLVPTELWHHFRMLNRLSRCSGKEGPARDYARQIAESEGLDWAMDAAGNLVIYRPATSDTFNRPEPVAVQTHLDMVCEKEAGVTHDFATDPVRPRRVGNHIFATGTTLGADNGIGVAASLALLTTPAIEHGPLELLFTVKEEIGLCGAAALDLALLRSRQLINLDTEDSDMLTVGSAGGANACLSLGLSLESLRSGWIGRQLRITGLKGGHSGLEIHHRLGNAIKLLVEILMAAKSAGIDFRIGSLQGGEEASAIPRDCAALLALHPLSIAKFDELIRQEQDRLLNAWSTDEPSIQLGTLSAVATEEVWSLAFGQSVLDLLKNLPSGVLKMSVKFPGSTETSANLAKIRSEQRRVEIVISVRSLVETQIAEFLAAFGSQGRKFGANMRVEQRYPAWLPNLNSVLLRVADQVFRQVYGKTPSVCPLHGGLECSLIVQKIPGMDAISFGPLIRFAHTPQENVDVTSVGGMWKMLVSLLEALGRAGLDRS
jgi:dipeptidase D